MTRYVFLAIFICGFLAGAAGPDPGNAISTAFGTVVLAAMVYFFFKAISTIGDRIANWDTTNPGEPMIKSGGSLTEYDETIARRTGEYAGKAMAKELLRNGGTNHETSG